MRRVVIASVLGGWVVAATGCGNESVPKTPGPGRIKPLGATSEADATPDSLGSDPVNPLENIQGNILDATYNLSIKAGFLQVCKGTLNIKVNASVATGGGAGGGLPFQMPDSCLSCMGAKIDISKFLQSMGGSVGSTSGPPPAAADVIHIQDGVIGIKDMGGVKFSPARPILPSFMALKPEELRNLNTSWNTTMANTISGESGSGIFYSKVVESDQPYQSPDMGYTFKKSLKFETTYSGFDSVKGKSQSMLLDKMGMVVSIDPLAFPRIFVELNAGKMRAEMQQSGQSINLDQLESAQCGVNSGFTKFMMGIFNDPQKLQQIQGLLGGSTGGTGSPMAVIGKLVMDAIINRTTIVVAGDLVKMEGLDTSK